MHEMAMRSRELWLQVLGASGIWHEKVGSLHLAYEEDEAAVLAEFAHDAPSSLGQMIGVRQPQYARADNGVIVAFIDQHRMISYKIGCSGVQVFECSGNSLCVLA